MAIEYVPSSDAENKKNDIAKNQLDTWEKKEKISSHSEQVLSSLPEDGSWAQMKDLYPKYCDKVENPLHKITVARVLNDFSNIGEVEKHGNYRCIKYRKADRPVEAVRKGFNRQSVDIPPWIMERVEKVVQKEVERQVEHHLEERAEDFREKVLSHDMESKVESIKQNQNESKKLLIDIIQEEGEIQPKKLYKEFRDRCDRDKPPVDRTLRKHLQDLGEKGVIKAEGSGRWRTYKSVNS